MSRAKGLGQHPGLTVVVVRGLGVGRIVMGRDLAGETEGECLLAPVLRGSAELKTTLCRVAGTAEVSGVQKELGLVR